MLFIKFILVLSILIIQQVICQDVIFNDGVGSANYINPYSDVGNRFTAYNNNYRIRQPRPTDELTNFAWNLFRNARAQTQYANLVLSPILVQFILSVLSAGADDYTKNEIQRVIGNIDSNQLRQLIQQIRTTQSRNELDYASAMFFAKDLKLNEQFILYAINNQVKPFNIDFTNVRELDAKVTNWVTQQTRDKIRKIVDIESLQGLRLLLANTIYFRGFWRTNFNETERGTFQLSPDTGKPVIFMKATLKLRGNEFTTLNGLTGAWVELPYEGNEFSMILILPSIRHGLNNFIKQMTKDDLLSIIDSTDESYKRVVHLILPRFSIETSFSLTNTLIQMNLTRIFTPNSGLIGLTSNNEFLRVDDILQKARLNVDEKGTVAAAVTTISIVTLSISSDPEEMNFVVDQPFIAMILDKRNHVPLFIAKVLNP